MTGRRSKQGRAGHRLAGGLFELTTLVTRLVFLNLLWVGFSLLGAVILGVFPATNALYAAVRREIVGDFRGPLFVVFLRDFKAEFWRANALGYCMTVIAILLAADYVYFTDLPWEAGRGLRVFALAGAIGLIVCSLYVYPACAHFGTVRWTVVKKALHSVYRAPATTALLVAAGLTCGYLFWLVPAIALVAGPALLSLAITWPADRALSRLWPNSIGQGS